MEDGQISPVEDQEDVAPSDASAEPAPEPEQAPSPEEAPSPGPAPTATIGVVSAVAAPILGGLALTFFLLLGRGLDVDTANVRFVNGLVVVARVGAPALALFGAVHVFGTWHRSRRADALPDAQAGPRLPARRRLGAALLSLNVLAAAVFGGIVHADAYVLDHIDAQMCVHGDKPGHYGKLPMAAGAMACELTVTNASTSTVTLHWTAVSDPPGAVFDPASGTLAPGETSPRILVDVGLRCPVTFILHDEHHRMEILGGFNSACP